MYVTRKLDTNPILIPKKEHYWEEFATFNMSTIKKDNKKARHFPYAYKIDNIIRKSDDKEPSGTASNPILNIIERKNLNNVLIIIVRYFGGIKLGAGGLIRAYSNTANEVTNKNSY